MDLVLIKALLEQLENIISDFDERELDDTDWEDLNRNDLLCLFNALSLAKRKAEEQDISDKVQVIGMQYAKEQIVKMIKDNRIEDCNNDTKFGVNTGLDIAVRIVEQLLS